MKHFLIVFILLNFCSQMRAQFHTIVPFSSRHEVKILKDCSKPEVSGIRDTLAMVKEKGNEIDNKKRLERYMHVSLPLDKIKVTSPYGMRKDPFTGKQRMHNGIDLQARNDKVYAMFAGIVRKTGYDNRSGSYIILQHGDYTISYCHLSKVLVKEKQFVCSGERIGISGNTGRSTNPHLHLSVKSGQKHINPDILLQFIQQNNR